jgi:hypothetical protein
MRLYLILVPVNLHVAIEGVQGRKKGKYEESCSNLPHVHFNENGICKCHRSARALGEDQ